MVVTLRIETDEGARAVSATEQSDGMILLVPKVNGEYAKVGTVARIQDSETGAVVVEGKARARVGAGRTGDQGALWVEAEQYPEADVYDEALDDLADEYRAVVREVLDQRGMSGVGERLLGIEDPSQLADLAVYSPDLSLEQKVELLETLDIRERLGKLMTWMSEVLADLTLRQKVRESATERIDKSQRDYLLAPAARGDQEGTRRRRRCRSEYRQKLAEPNSRRQ